MFKWLFKKLYEKEIAETKKKNAELLSKNAKLMKEIDGLVHQRERLSIRVTILTAYSDPALAKCIDEIEDRAVRTYGVKTNVSNWVWKFL